MKRALLVVVVCVLLAPGTVFANPILIDHYASTNPAGGRTFIVAGTGSDPQSDTGLFDVPGGKRDTTFTVTSGLATSTANIITTPVHELAANWASGSLGNIKVEYGAYAVIGGAGPDLNLNLSIEYGITFEVVAADLNGGTMNIDLLIDNDGSSGGPTTRTSGPVTINIGSGFYQVPFSSFSGLTTVELGDVDGIRYTVAGSIDSFDITIDSMQSTGVIPEPASLSLLGLGVLALLRRRRKS